MENRIVKISYENKEISKKHLRVLAKKFLHEFKLKDFYRVIRSSEDTLKIREKKVYEE